MRLKKKIYIILSTVTPLIVMALLIPFVISEYALSMYMAIIIFLFLQITGHTRNDLIILCVGLLATIFCEIIFYMNDMEVFKRTSLFGFIPLWLPLFSGYMFLSIKRITESITR